MKDENTTAVAAVDDEDAPTSSSSSSTTSTKDNNVDNNNNNDDDNGAPSTPNKRIIHTIHSIQSQMIIDRLKPIKRDVLDYVQKRRSSSQSSDHRNHQQHQQQQPRLSQTLSLMVNDSALQGSGLNHKTFQTCYTIGDLIGEGGYANVYRCQHKRNKMYYAVKIISNNDEYEQMGKESILREIDCMKRLYNEGGAPYVVPLLDVFYDDDDDDSDDDNDHRINFRRRSSILDNKTYMIMEEITGGDLLAKLIQEESLTEHDARKMARTLLEAIRFCHQKQVVHRDIKPENILLVPKLNQSSSSTSTFMDIKLADFGFAKRLITNNETGEHEPLYTLCGTPDYVAPELYTHEDGYDERCDIWSAGVVIYVCLGGYVPFEATNLDAVEAGEEEHDDLPEVICEGKLIFHHRYWSKISESPKDLIWNLLRVDLDERATLDEALNCEWLQRRDKERFSTYMEKINNSSRTSLIDNTADSSFLLDASTSSLDVWLLSREDLLRENNNNNNNATFARTNYNSNNNNNNNNHHSSNKDGSLSTTTTESFTSIQEDGNIASRKDDGSSNRRYTDTNTEQQEEYDDDDDDDYDHDGCYRLGNDSMTSLTLNDL